MDQFRKAPKLYNSEGEKRRVGFELEFANLKIEKASSLIKDLYGGEINYINRYFVEVNNTKLGDFSVKLDMNVLYEKKYSKVLSIFNEIIQNGDPDRQREKKVERILERIFRSVVPYEIISPPIEIDALDAIEKLRKSLYEQEAKGTEDSTFYAFATHINAELPALNMQSLFIHLKSFLLLYSYLLEAHQTNISRKLTPFINPFPKKYVNHIIQTHEKPSIDQFIDDYNQFNPTRNRPLDLYPVLAFLNEEKINKLKNVGKINKRPTFHYRLPNSSIHFSGWSLAEEWNSWCIVEELANEPDILAQMTEDYISVFQHHWYNPEKKWKEKSKQWVKEKLQA